MLPLVAFRIILPDVVARIPLGILILPLSVWRETCPEVVVRVFPPAPFTLISWPADKVIPPVPPMRMAERAGMKSIFVLALKLTFPEEAMITLTTEMLSPVEVAERFPAPVLTVAARFPLRVIRPEAMRVIFPPPALELSAWFNVIVLALIRDSEWLPPGQVTTKFTVISPPLESIITSFTPKAAPRAALLIFAGLAVKGTV